MKTLRNSKELEDFYTSDGKLPTIAAEIELTPHLYRRLVKKAEEGKISFNSVVQQLILAGLGAGRPCWTQTIALREEDN